MTCWISCAICDCVALFPVIMSFAIIVLCFLWCFSYRAASFFCSISASCCCFFICISFSLRNLFSIRAAFFCAISSSPCRSSWVAATQTNNYSVWHRSSCVAGCMRQCLSLNIVMCNMKKNTKCSFQRSVYLKWMKKNNKDICWSFWTEKHMQSQPFISKK